MYAALPPLLLCLLVRTDILTSAQANGVPAPALPQLNTFNAQPGSPLYLDAQSTIQSFNLDNTTAQAVQTAVDFERSNWAGGTSVYADPFYKLPPNASDGLPAGSLLKVEDTTNVTLYTVAPELALSRILFNTKDLNGTVIPASAFVLWPYMPRSTRVSGMPVVGWAHGTSGITGECAPSHIQNLWYQFNGPFALALQGYVVVAPDYAGLGVGATANGSLIPHQWAAFPAAANDIVYAVQAAQSAWPQRLSREFVAFGHSEGGGAAWGVAQQQVLLNTSGYLGAIAGSPLTNIGAYSQAPLTAPGTNFLVSLILNTMSSVYPGLQVDDYLTPQGVQALNTYKALNGCQSVAEELFYTPGEVLAQPNWSNNSYFPAFADLVSNGGKEISGPLFVLQGLADTTVDPTGTTAAVNLTCAAHPDSNIQYATFEGVGHVPVMNAAQQLWLKWIEDRFNGVPADTGCINQTFHPALSVGAYQSEVNYFLEYPLYLYETS